MGWNSYVEEAENPAYDLHTCFKLAPRKKTYNTASDFSENHCFFK